MRECPLCHEPDPIYYIAEGDETYGMWSCPECGWEVQDYCYTNHANRDQEDIEASIAGDTPWDREHAQDHESRSTNDA